MYINNDEHFGELLSWNYKNHTDFYNGECSNIRGSSGEFYPKDRRRDHITLYSSEMCSYIDLNYVKDVNVKGIHAYKYSPQYLFDNGK